ncbi:dihydropteroate synthase [Salinicola rhizosphaerae]|uniref:Dihydropteroate synthase n=1 Tax=Salinicola rhizosphaerae TaxID=1443141 RepID=A0ABQ3DTJ0_9GAMM|nr:dihydropteroate synthase [Salinicola rhizosphaerae]GHB12152.1 dihydropteroate synthase [Salinicola rhizosphaerae]
MRDTESAASLRCGKHLLDLSRPRVMGILNVTPDSFSDGGRHDRLDDARRHAERLLVEGAAIIDVGGESTRPGAEPVSLEVERERVLPVVEMLVQEFDALVSVDTSSPELMTAVAEAGAGLINDVRSLSRPGALAAASATSLPVCLMHMLGEPSTMQQAPHYDQPIEVAVANFLREQVARCESAGIARERLLLDPGFGFAKTLEHNLELLNRMASLETLGLPLLVGMSRKSMIGKTLGRAVEERLPGGLALAVMAVERGARIIRVHDVAPTKDAIDMAWAVLQERSDS